MNNQVQKVLHKNTHMSDNWLCLPEFNFCIEAIKVGGRNGETILQINFGTFYLKKAYLNNILA